MNKKMLVTIVLVVFVLGIAIAQQSKQSLTGDDFEVTVTRTIEGDAYYSASFLLGLRSIPNECRTDRKVEVVQTRLATYRCWMKDENSGMYGTRGFTNVTITDIKCTQKGSEEIVDKQIAFFKAYHQYPTDGCMLPGAYN